MEQRLKGIRLTIAHYRRPDPVTEAYRPLGLGEVG
jgi:hypothetical protein